MITRNGKDFYLCRSGINQALYLIQVIGEHPINFDEYGFAEKMIGRKVWWRSQPAVITRFIGEGQACVILEPDGIRNFKFPEEFKDDIPYEYDGYIKADIFDEHIWWFRY